MPTIDDVNEAAGVVKETYTTVMAEMAAADDELKRKRDALEAEKQSMKGAHDVQKSKIKLIVGGATFVTSLSTLTSIPGNFFASMFSGNYEMLPDGDDGSYFIDRDGTHFRHILNFLREPDSTSNKTCYNGLTKSEKSELDKELQFYGLYDRFHSKDWKFRELSREEAIAVKFLENALEKDEGYPCDKAAIESAVSFARALSFTMCGDLLKSSYTNRHWMITEDIIEGAPVWKTTFWDCDTLLMYRKSPYNYCVHLSVTNWELIWNRAPRAHTPVAPTEVPVVSWRSGKTATDATYHHCFGGDARLIPQIRFIDVEKLPDDYPVMQKALARLAELA